MPLQLHLLLLLPLLAGGQDTALLVAGGQGEGAYHPLTHAELWTPEGALNCTLPHFGRSMYDPSVSSVQGRVVACYEDSCDTLTQTGWDLKTDLVHGRKYHSSSITSEEGILLLGGSVSSWTTELLPADGGPSVESFSLPRPGFKDHCSIQLSPSTIILTGGKGTEEAVTQYSSGLADWAQATERELPSLLTGRFYHACGTYMDGQKQMLLVTGGFNLHELDTTEIIDYTTGDGGVHWSWREAGRLPEPRDSLRAASLAGLLHVTGGHTSYPQHKDFDEVLSWDPVAEVWSVAGHLELARQRHGVAVVEMGGIVSNFCFS